MKITVVADVSLVDGTNYSRAAVEEVLIEELEGAVKELWMQDARDTQYGINSWKVVGGA